MTSPARLRREGQSKPVAEKLWSREPDPIRQLAEDAEGAEAHGGAYDEGYAGRTSVAGGRRHPVIL